MEKFVVAPFGSRRADCLRLRAGTDDWAASPVHNRGRLRRTFGSSRVRVQALR